MYFKSPFIPFQKIKNKKNKNSSQNPAYSDERVLQDAKLTNHETGPGLPSTLKLQCSCNIKKARVQVALTRAKTRVVAATTNTDSPTVREWRSAGWRPALAKPQHLF
jgi:DNA-binding transcriptional regulator YiaG